MTRRLNTYVYVHVDGVSTAYGPGDDVPGPVAALITAPDVWDGDDIPASVSVPAVPPKAGRGSSLKAWLAYADAHGFEFDEDVSRDDIVAALDGAGVPTE